MLHVMSNLSLTKNGKQLSNKKYSLSKIYFMNTNIVLKGGGEYRSQMNGEHLNNSSSFGLDTSLNT